MKTRLKAVSKALLGLFLASGIAGAVAVSAQPAQAGVVVSVGVGGGYAAPYHWYRWHDQAGWHREWVRIGWVPPAAYVGPAYAYGPGYADGPTYGYGPSYPAYYGPGYVRRDWDGDRHRDWDRDHR
jgi:hypothetical protein